MNRYQDTSWWNLEGSEAATQMEAYVNSICEYNQSKINYMNLRHAKLYSGRLYDNLRGVSYGLKKPSALEKTSDVIAENIVRSAVDTVVAKITKQKVRPKFVTDGGSYSQQMNAENLNRFLQGLFYQCDVHQIAPMIFRDACIFGDGFIKVFIKEVEGGKKRVAIERVLSDEIVVDMADAYYNNPRAIHQVKWVSKDALKQMYPEKAVKIEMLQGESRGGSSDPFVHTVKVVEGWSLPSEDGKHKGKHIIQVGGELLFEEEWTEHWFPFVRMTYSEALTGYFGSGIAEELTGIQIEINRLLRTIQKAMYLLSSPKIFMQKGSSNPRHMTNEIGTIVEYEGQPPIVSTPNAVPAGAFQQVQQYKSDAYGLVGISQLSAQSQKPAGLNSGRALTEFRDSETERFSQTVKVYEQFHIELAEMLLNLVRMIGDDYEVSSFDRVNGMEAVKWGDIKVDATGYVMQIFSLSALPKDPVGRLQTIEGYLQAGILDPDDALELLELPDLDAKVKFQLASNRVIRKNLDKILSGEIAALPDPSDNLQYAYKLAGQYYAYAREKDYDDNVQEQLRNYMEDVESLIQQSQQQLAPPPLAPQELPGQEPIPPAEALV